MIYIYFQICCKGCLFLDYLLYFFTMRHNVILTSYNRTYMLERAIESVLGQTEQDLSLWIIDDGSPQPTRDVILKYKLQHSDKIIYIQTNKKDEDRKKVIDYADNINKALTLVPDKGYVYYLVCDDFYAPHHVEVLGKALDKRPDWKVVFGTQLVIREDGSEKFIRNSPSIVNQAACKIDHIQVAHRKSLINEIGYWPTDPKHYGHGDAEMWKKINEKYPFHRATTDITNYNTHHKNSIQAIEN
jgi:glycosyltransferase involved in cell wall biosynthesis